MIITIEEINNTIKDILENTDIMHIDSVYEKEKNYLKLIIFFTKMLGDKSIIYTKFIFKVDTNKTKLIKNEFIYLYDINCKYKVIKIDDIDEFKNKFKEIIKKEIFGQDLKILSEFITSASFTINDYFSKNDINYLNISNVYYEPKVYTTPCKALIFPFKITINNVDTEFIISKNDDVYVFTFKIFDNIINIEKRNLTTLIETIADTYKNNFKND